MAFTFSPADIARLYGKRIFVVQERTASPAAPAKEVRQPKTAPPPAVEASQAEVAAPPLTQAITWKLKPGTPKVIFLLPELEFSNKQLTELLRQIVVASQVPTEEVGFGVVHTKPTSDELAAMPAPFGFLLDEALNPFPDGQAEVNGKRFWVAKRLSLMAKDKALKAELWGMMKEFMALVRNA